MPKAKESLQPSTKSLSPAWPERHIIHVILPFILLIIVVIGGLWLASRDDGSSASSGSPHLVIDDYNSSTLYLSDANGKQQYKQSYPKFSYLNFEASSPKGKVLLSRGITTAAEDFSIISDGKAQTLSAAATKALHQAIVLDNSHHSFFLGEDNLVYVTCPQTGTCKLMNLDLSSNQAKQVIDTGAKPAFTGLPPIYPLGVSSDDKTIYLRTTVDNKLGKTAAAVYAVDSKGKVSNSWSMPRNADYTPVLSPDTKQIVYKISGSITEAKSGISISILNLSNNKTSTAKWTGGEISDTPDSLVWSPDSRKVLIVGSNALLPGAQTTSTYDVNFGYLDAASNQITKLPSVKDSTHHQVVNPAWLNDDAVVYEQDTSTKANDFSNPQVQIDKLSLGGNVSQIKTPAGELKATIFY
ncbi:MAG TPA: hypothetical protein VFT49_03955 [Candidatus Saccharimonadales bacterium]|nr:hypothetical protein [Candidatus Saccharimonadales bacterium]